MKKWTLQTGCRVHPNAVCRSAVSHGNNRWHLTVYEVNIGEIIFSINSTRTRLLEALSIMISEYGLSFMGRSTCWLSSVVFPTFIICIWETVESFKITETVRCIVLDIHWQAISITSMSKQS